MVELTRTNEPVLISWLIAALAAESIEVVVLDVFTSIAEGSAGAIPRRLMVFTEDLPRARQLLGEAERLAAESTPADEPAGIAPAPLGAPA